jgi:hypothetical protein
MSNSNLFHVIEPGAVILCGRNGVFRQAKLYRRGEHLFASFGAGFLRLYQGNGTSSPSIRWEHIEADADDFKADKHGRLLAPGAQ